MVSILPLEGEKNRFKSVTLEQIEKHKHLPQVNYSELIPAMKE